jgi:hypothetical protein
MFSPYVNALLGAPPKVLLFVSEVILVVFKEVRKCCQGFAVLWERD